MQFPSGGHFHTSASLDSKRGRWLDEKRYWIAYYQAYSISLVILAILSKPRDIPAWAAVVTVSTGIATGFAFAMEVGGNR